MLEPTAASTVPLWLSSSHTGKGLGVGLSVGVK